MIYGVVSVIVWLDPNRKRINKMFGLFYNQYTKKNMKYLFICIVLLNQQTLQADQSFNYYLNKDEGGYFIQTEKDGSYYLDHKFDHNTIKTGQKGQYNLVTNKHGTFLVTSHHGRFLIDSKTIEKSEASFDIPISNEKTKIIISDHQVIVPVTIRVGTRKTTTFLLLDTGATTIALHSDLAKYLKIKIKKKELFQVANGKKIELGMGVLTSVQAGPIEKKNLSVCIIDSQHVSKRYQGLLGMNFLKNLNYRIDFNKKLIIWD
jgi:hypothetical protein